MKAKFVLLSVVALVMSLLVGVASAQEATETPTTVRDRDQARIGLNILHDIGDVVSEATGLTAQEIMQQLRDGATLSEIISANGGDVEAVKAEVATILSERISTAVENGNLTQERADEILATLPERIATAFDQVHDGLGIGGGQVRDRLENGIIAILIGAVSDSTGLTQQEILQQVRDGASVADILSENGGDVEAIVSTVMADLTERVTARIEAGDISQERADEILVNSEEMLRGWLSGEIQLPRPDRPNGGNRPDGRPNGGNRPNGNNGNGNNGNGANNSNDG